MPSALTNTQVNEVQGSILVVYQPILIVIDHFLPIFSEIYHQKVLGRVYSSRCVYLALYGKQYFPMTVFP